MDAIRQRLIDEYNYDPGPYEGYFHETDNDKLLVKLDWNIKREPQSDVPVQLSRRDARPAAAPVRAQLQQHRPRTQRDAASRSSNSGYAINNSSTRLPASSTAGRRVLANRFFASYNRFRDFRDAVQRRLSRRSKSARPEYLHHGRPRAVLDPQHPGPGRLPAHQQLQLVPREARLHARRELRVVRLLQLVQHLPARRLLPSDRSIPSAAAPFRRSHEFFAATTPGPNQQSTSMR